MFYSAFKNILLTRKGTDDKMQLVKKPFDKLVGEAFASPVICVQLLEIHKDCAARRAVGFSEIDGRAV